MTIVLIAFSEETPAPVRNKIIELENWYVDIKLNKLDK